jgi:mono/diheme cytochrome c family protein
MKLLKIKLIPHSSILLVLILICINSSNAKSQKAKPWVVPENSSKLKNPVASSPASIEEGKVLWKKHCKSCHGVKGLGDGPKAAKLKTEPGNFSLANFQSQSDGALFYKTSEGRDDMPAFKKKIPDAEERWSIVNYMRTLKK